jgi:SDR family mycofactocin-dependent oxidoreductase
MAAVVSRIALVTGAARGIGAATARALAADGWTVVAVDRASPDPRLPYAMGTEAELQALTADGIEIARADVADAAALGELVAGIDARHGGLDAVVAAAGVIAGGVPLWEMPAEQLDAVFDVDLHGAVATARATIPALLARPEPRHGRFIAVASTAAVRGMPMVSAYCAAKAGVAGLVRGLAAELRGTGVTANAVSPGSTRTPILDESARLYGLASAEEFAAQQPLERLLEPAEVAALVVWLAGPTGAAVTGANLPVDGGLAI